MTPDTAESQDSAGKIAEDEVDAQSEDTDLGKTKAVGDVFEDETFSYKIVSADETLGTVEITGYASSLSAAPAALVIPETVKNGNVSYTPIRFGVECGYLDLFAIVQDSRSRAVTSLSIPSGFSLTASANGDASAYTYSCLCAFSNLQKYVVAEGNPYYTVQDGVLFSKSMDTLLAYPVGNKQETYTVPSGVETAGMYAFSRAGNLTEITLADSVKTVGSSCFYTCNKLKTVNLGSGVETIGEYAFRLSSGITLITGGGNLQDIDGSSYLFQTAWAKNFASNNQPIIMGKLMVKYYGTDTEVVVPEGIERIDSEAFLKNKTITKVTLPSTIVSIGDNAFNGCTNLAEIVGLENVSDIGLNALKDTAFMNNHTPDENGFLIINNVLFSYSGSEKDIVIPDGVKRINGNCFGVSTPSDTIDSVTFPESLEKIGAGAFSNSGLDTIIGGQNVTLVDSGAFTGCDITKFDGPAVTTVGTGAFSYCENLEEVSIPRIDDLSLKAFDECTALKKLVLKNSPMGSVTGSFENCLSDEKTLVIYTGKVNASILTKAMQEDVDAGRIKFVCPASVTVMIKYYTEKVNSITLDVGEKVTKPEDPVRSGYTFAGWYTDENTYANAYNFDSEVSEDMTIYAKWIKNEDPIKKGTPGWNKDSKGWMYMDASGVSITNNWVKTGGKWYHFDNSGYMQIGWQDIGGKRYYLSGTQNDGSMKFGWLQLGSNWYYLSAGNDDGALKTGWQKINSKWYYFGESKNDGAMRYGWQKINNQWYYLSASSNDGAMKYGWCLIGNCWYYLSDSVNDGAMKIGWQLIGNKWYYLSDSANDGAMKSGWQLISGTWYYLYPDKSPVGHMASNTWIGRYYVNAGGAWTRTR